MFKPVYRFTPFLIKKLEEIAALQAVVHASPFRLPHKLKLERELIHQSVHSSTWIEGNPLSLAQVEALDQHKNISTDKKAKREVENCLEAVRWVIKHRKEKITERGLQKLHTLMMKDLLSRDKTGFYRPIQNYVINARGTVIFTPPPPSQVGKRMKELFQWRTSKEIHPVVLSAVFHHEFLTIHPFSDGNGRVARAASQWILFGKGYQPLYALGLDDYFAEDRTRYYEKIQQVRELDFDFTHWIEYVAEGLSGAVEKVSARLKTLSHKTQGRQIQFTPKQAELLELLREKDELSAADIGEVMKINRARVNQLIQPLVKARIVSKRGMTRGASYHIA